MFAIKKSHKSGGVSALSERDIQEKLYGRFRSPSMDSKAGGASVAFEEEEIQGVSKHVPAKIMEKKSVDLFESATTNVQEEPSEVSDVEMPVESKEVRSAPRPLEFKTRFQAPERHVVGSARENSKYSPNRSTLEKKPMIQLSLPKFDWVGGLRSFFVGLAETVSPMPRNFLRVIESLNPSSERARALISWSFGIAALLALLFSVHVLNVRREQAMKEARVHRPAAMAKKIKIQKKVVLQAVTEEPSVKTAPAAVDQVLPESESIAQQQVQTEPAAETVSPKEQKPALRSEGKGKFVIQVATYVIEDDANQLRVDVRKIHISAFVKGLTRSSGKTYYSVFLGRFETFKSAQETLSNFKKSDVARSFNDAFIRTLS